MRCVGATARGATWQRIVTPRGVGVGDPVSLIRKWYGRSAHYVAAPQGGMTDFAGYAVTNRLGTLVFFFTRAHQPGPESPDRWWVALVGLLKARRS